MSGPSPQESAAALGHLNMLSAARAAAGRSLTEDDLAKLDELPDGGRCSHCGGIHARSCPRVRRMEFHPNGIVAAVEFWPHDRVNWEGVLFEDQADDEALGLLEDASILAAWLGDRKGQPQYVLEAKRRVMAAYEAEAHAQHVTRGLGTANVSLAGHVGCTGFDPANPGACPCECHRPR